MGTDKRLLVVDDSPTNRNLLARRLQRAGFAVETAEDGQQALAAIQRREFELVLLDNMMPGMSGIDLLKLLRATYSPAQLPVIMVTALTESERIVEALSLGANDYITKPIDFAVALARIRSQLTRKQGEDALRKSSEGYALAAQGANDGLWDWRGLRRAVDNNEFLLHYQPSIRLATSKPAGFDALLRWRHPELGLILPSQFLSVAEETGLIVPIGWWVLREACSTMRNWHREFPSHPPLTVGVTLSVRQFHRPDVVNQISAILKETGIEPSSLQLELTEIALIEDTSIVPATLKRLKGLGVCLQVDDFGTGYSSLHYLHQLPFDSLKIDRSFVQNMCYNQTCAEVVKTAVALARSLGIQVVAEGVETEEQLEWLKALGCDFAQGHLFSRPLDKDQARALLAEAENQGLVL